MGMLTIGQVARHAAVGVETVRFYEREGLIEEPQRRESGYRQFPVDVISRLHLIRQARDLGFSLKEIKEILNLRSDGDTTCCDVQRQAEGKIADVDRKIQDLERIKAALRAVVEDCEANLSSACPFLEALAAQEEG